MGWPLFRLLLELTEWPVCSRTKRNLTLPTNHQNKLPQRRLLPILRQNLDHSLRKPDWVYVASLRSNQALHSFITLRVEKKPNIYAEGGCLVHRVYPRGGAIWQCYTGSTVEGQSTEWGQSVPQQWSFWQNDSTRLLFLKTPSFVLLPFHRGSTFVVSFGGGPIHPNGGFIGGAGVMPRSCCYLRWAQTSRKLDLSKNQTNRAYFKRHAGKQLQRRIKKHLFQPENMHDSPLQRMEITKTREHKALPRPLLTKCSMQRKNKSAGVRKWLKIILQQMLLTEGFPDTKTTLSKRPFCSMFQPWAIQRFQLPSPWQNRVRKTGDLER